MEANMKKDGLVFMLDVTIALILVIILLVVSSYYINKSRDPGLSKLQLIKRGSDIVTQLNYQNVLDTADDDKIEYNLTNTILQQYEMRMYLNFTGQKPNVTVGTPIKQFGQVGSGRMVFVLSDAGVVKNYYTVRYFIWTR